MSEKLTVIEAGKLYLLSRNTIYNYLERGLPFTREQRGLRLVTVIDKDELDRFMKLEEANNAKEADK